MFIVLDTNIFFENWHLKGPGFSLLEKFIQSGRAELVVPEIVLLETLNCYRREVEKQIPRLQQLSHLIPALQSQINLPDMAQICSDYEASLRLRLDELSAQVPAHVDIPHSDIVTRALACRKPFRESDKGYRDTLLWEVIRCKIASPNRLTFLLTNNHEDFCVPKDNRQLHQHLVDDLIAAGLAGECVQVYPSIKLFLDDHIIPHLKQIRNEATEELQHGSYRSFSIQKWFDEHRDLFINSTSHWIEPLLSRYPSFESPVISYIEDPDEINMGNVVLTEDDKAYLDVTAFADVIVDVFIHKSDYYSIPETIQLDIMDDNWNEHYVWAQTTVGLPINFSLTFNILSEIVEQFEINPLPEIFGWCPHCHHPILSDATEACPKCGKSLISKRIISFHF